MENISAKANLQKQAGPSPGHHLFEHNPSQTGRTANICRWVKFLSLEFRGLECAE